MSPGPDAGRPRANGVGSGTLNTHRQADDNPHDISLEDEVASFLTQRGWQGLVRSRPLERDFTRPTRRGGRETSAQAGASGNRDLRSAEQAVFDTCLALGSFHDELLVTTYQQQVAEGIRPPQASSGIRSRRATCVALGLVRATDRRQLTATGRKAIVWEVADA